MDIVDPEVKTWAKSLGVDVSTVTDILADKNEVVFFLYYFHLNTIFSIMNLSRIKHIKLQICQLFVDCRFLARFKQQ